MESLRLFHLGGACAGEKCFEAFSRGLQGRFQPLIRRHPSRLGHGGAGKHKVQNAAFYAGIADAGFRRRRPRKPHGRHEVLVDLNGCLSQAERWPHISEECRRDLALADHNRKIAIFDAEIAHEVAMGGSSGKDDVRHNFSIKVAVIDRVLLRGVELSMRTIDAPGSVSV